MLLYIYTRFYLAVLLVYPAVFYELLCTDDVVSCCEVLQLDTVSYKGVRTVRV